MLSFSFRVIFCLCVFILAINATPSAQVKKSVKGNDKPDTTIVYETAKPDTVKPEYDYSADMKETVIIIKKKDTSKVTPAIPTYKDTVIVIKNTYTTEQLKAMKKARVEEVAKKNNYCNCVKMDIKVAEVLEYETYLNYEFIFKNNCDIDVWISSKHFRFTPLTSMGTPVKVLRKLSFVQRYGHPDFVKIQPGETYNFNYSDDAFFEYDLNKGQNYKFVFEHRNFGDRSRMAPEKTYLCAQKRTQLISVK